MIRTRKLLTVTAALVMSVLLLASCGDNSTDATSAAQAPVESAPSQAIRIDIQGQEVWFDPTLANYATTTPLMTSEFPMEFSMGEYTGWDVTINGVPVTSGETPEIQIEELSKDAPVPIVFTNQITGEVVNQTIKTLPDSFPDYTVLSNVDDGVYYFTEANFAAKMNYEGDIIFYYFATSAIDFDRTEVNGNVYYTFSMAGVSHEFPSLGVGVGPIGKCVVLDEKYKVVKTIPALYETERTPAGIPVDQHEFTMLGDNHYLLIGIVGERVNNFPEGVEHSEFGTRVGTNVIQEIVNDEVVFEWYSSDYPELYTYTTDEYSDYFNQSSLFADYAHLNSVTIDPDDGNFVCSFRHLCCILKLDRTTGEIIWTLGGDGDEFGLTEEQKTYYQHHAIPFEGGLITVFDNGNNVGRTRIVEYTLDEEEKKLIFFQEYTLEKQFSFFSGGAQRIEGEDVRYVIGWGGKKSSNAMFSDINFTTKEVLFEVVREASEMEHVYRAFRYDS